MGNRGQCKQFILYNDLGSVKFNFKMQPPGLVSDLWVRQKEEVFLKGERKEQLYVATNGTRIIAAGCKTLN